MTIKITMKGLAVNIIEFHSMKNPFLLKYRPIYFNFATELKIWVFIF